MADIEQPPDGDLSPGPGAGAYLTMFGVVIAAVALLGTIITASDVFSDDTLFGDELPDFAKWEPVLTGIAAIALGLVVAGVGMIVTRMDQRSA